MVWYAFLAMLFVGFVTTGFADGFFSKNATLVMSDTARNPANGDMTVSVRPLDEERESAFPALLRVEIGTRQFERWFDFGLNAQVLWSADANRFAVTGSAQGANGRYKTAVVDLTPEGIRWTDVNGLVEKAFGHPVRCGWPELPNVVAVVWLSRVQLVLAAQIINHSNCDSYGTFVAYQVRLGRPRIERTYGQLEAKKLWGSALGPDLADARDGCITNPKSCYVPAHHPELAPLGVRRNDR